MSRGRWAGGVMALQSSVVGVISKTASGSWEASGCMSDWCDTPLGTFDTERKAKRAVEKWAGAEDDELAKEQGR